MLLPALTAISRLEYMLPGSDIANLRVNEMHIGKAFPIIDKRGGQGIPALTAIACLQQKAGYTAGYGKAGLRINKLHS